MKRTITSDQIAAALKQEELGIPLEDVSVSYTHLTLPTSDLV